MRDEAYTVIRERGYLQDEKPLCVNKSMLLCSVLTSLITYQRRVDIKIEKKTKNCFSVCVFLLQENELKKFRSGTGTCAILSSMWCCILGLFALTSFISRSKTSGNDAYYKLGQTWSTPALFSRNTASPDSAVNTIPSVCVGLLTITYAYKWDPRLSKHSRRIFKVSRGSEQVTWWENAIGRMQRAALHFRWMPFIFLWRDRHQERAHTSVTSARLLM